MEYKVVWRIEIEADNMIGACAEVRDIMLDPSSEAQAFEVSLGNEKEVLIDFHAEAQCPKCGMTMPAYPDKNCFICFCNEKKLFTY